MTGMVEVLALLMVLALVVLLLAVVGVGVILLDRWAMKDIPEWLRKEMHDLHR